MCKCIFVYLLDCLRMGLCVGVHCIVITLCLYALVILKNCFGAHECVY